MNSETIKSKINPSRSHWSRAVAAKAIEMLDDLVERYPHYEADQIFESPKILEKALLNGASNWQEWAHGGCGLIYDPDIAECYCTPSELKHVRGGESPPNPRESWLDVEARAAFQAARMVQRAARAAAETTGGVTAEK